MILLQRDTLKDSRSTGFANLRIFYEFLLNFKVHCKNYKGALTATIQMCHGVCRQPPGTFVPFNTRSLAREDEQGRGAGQNPAM